MSSISRVGSGLHLVDYVTFDKVNLLLSFKSNGYCQNYNGLALFLKPRALLYSKGCAIRSKLDPFNQYIDFNLVPYGATAFLAKAVFYPVIAPFEHG